MKAIEKRAAYLLGTHGDGFDPIKQFKMLHDEEKLRLVRLAQKWNLALGELEDD